MQHRKIPALKNLENGTISLRYDYVYHTQVQLQILATGAEAGYFCIRTAATEDNLHRQDVDMNADFREEVVAKAELFFMKVVVPEHMTGDVKKTMQDAAISTSLTEVGTEETQPADFPSGKCGLQCLEEPKEFKEMSIGCDSCNQWFHWQCVNLTGNENFLNEQNIAWMCDS